jgi:hypothetical protein
MGEYLAYNSTNFPKLLIRFPIFFIVLQIWLGLPHPSIASIPWCMCTHQIDLMGIHLLCCAHANKLIWTHDAIHYTFVAIVKDVGFHVGQEQLHVLPLNTFNFSYQWIDIVFTKDDICTLIDVVIANPAYEHIYFPNFAPPKDLLLLMWFKPKMELLWPFFPLVVKVFGCLHK